MNKILVKLSPINFHHKVYIIQNGEIVKTINATMPQLSDVISAHINEYNFDTVVLSGAKAYTAKIGSNLKIALTANCTSAQVKIDYV